DLGVRFHFANSLRKWVPYLQAAFTGRAVTVDRARIDGDRFDEVTFNGGGLSLGGGIVLYPWETVGIDLQLMVTNGEFTEFDAGNVTVRGLDVDANSSRLSVGASWWP